MRRIEIRSNRGVAPTPLFLPRQKNLETSKGGHPLRRTAHRRPQPGQAQAGQAGRQGPQGPQGQGTGQGQSKPRQGKGRGQGRPDPAIRDGSGRPIRGHHGPQFLGCGVTGGWQLSLPVVSTALPVSMFDVRCSMSSAPASPWPVRCLPRPAPSRPRIACALWPLHSALRRG